LRDRHLKDSIVEIKLLDNRLWCQICREKNCMHVYYTMARPELASLQDPEQPHKTTRRSRRT
ncbi:MAG: hypothetical protein KC440_05480, partial [Nitrosarchaeum sp.]|nr:hypothetical protein [Nitrosarchaeum sp.]